jgi:hypothetical protein
MLAPRVPAPQYSSHLDGPTYLITVADIAYWQVTMTIYGRGSYNRLYIYLPVLATWLVVGEVVYCLGTVVLARKSRKPVVQEGH